MRNLSKQNGENATDSHIHGNESIYSAFVVLKIIRFPLKELSDFNPDHQFLPGIQYALKTSPAPVLRLPRLLCLSFQ